jgi:hypothetical protein
MRLFTLLILVFTLLLLTACGKPVPPEKATYVGEWHSPTISLLITQNGNVVYNRVEGNESISIDAPLKGFIGNDFEVGISLITTVFVVSVVPHQENGLWKMTVDGNELTRTQ